MTPEEIDVALNDLEASLERLGSLYNQYFMGIEKLEPHVPQKALDRKIWALRREKMGSTAQRFRFQTQVQKYNTQNNHWRRICRQIEEGTYKRHIVLAQRRQGERLKTTADKAESETTKPVDAPAAPADSAKVHNEDFDFAGADFDSLQKSPNLMNVDLKSMDLGLDEPFSKAADSPTLAPSRPTSIVDSLDDPFAEAPKKPAGSSASIEAKKTARQNKTVTKVPSAPEKKAPSSASIPSGKPSFDDERAKKIYRTYLAARQRCNEPTENLTLDKVVKSLKKQFDEKGGNVDFKVVIRDGKAAIKTVRNK